MIMVKVLAGAVKRCSAAALFFLSLSFLQLYITLFNSIMQDF